jgi:hypothetical protein
MKCQLQKSKRIENRRFKDYERSLVGVNLKSAEIRQNTFELL